jgi:hypothetical protein
MWAGPSFTRGRGFTQRMTYPSFAPFVLFVSFVVKNDRYHHEGHEEHEENKTNINTYIKSEKIH